MVSNSIGKWLALTILGAFLVYFALAIFEPNFITSFVSFAETILEIVIGVGIVAFVVNIYIRKK